jgi:pyrroline-5-carboxylate reductase
MSTATEQLDHIDRIHDDDPAQAAQLLRTLDAAAVPDDRLRLLAFLANHVLGEKLGQWADALERIAPLAARPGAPLPVLRQHAVAAQLAGNAAAATQTIATLAARAESDLDTAALLVRACALEFVTPLRPADLAALAARAVGVASGPFDAAFGTAFNNTTNRLYYDTRAIPLAPAVRQALQRGADAALAFWSRTPGWMEHERALYLCAKVALRLGESATAVAAAERALAIVALNGNDAVERAFLLQLLATAVERAGARGRAETVRAEVAALAATLDADTRQLLSQDASEFPALPQAARVAFVGGGNLAAALISGLQREGTLDALHVVEVDAARRAQLEREFGASTAAAPDATLASFDVIVLAVKPQQMREACTALRAHAGSALLLSVAAGIRAADIARWCGTERVVRAMPNTPALIGQGISGVAALPAVSAAQQRLAERILASAGPVLWFDDETQLDPVTAISGSGPAYVFRFIEALQRAALDLGFDEAQARQLAVATFTGAAQLAAQSDEPVSVLRERVTSKGGTTAAALAVMEAAGIGNTIVDAVKAAHARAVQMGQAFGQD